MASPEQTDESQINVGSPRDAGIPSASSADAVAPAVPPPVSGPVPASWHFSRPPRWIDENAELADVLLEVARPDLYRTNAFRVTGVSIENTEQEINKQIEKRRMLASYGGAAPPQRGIFSSATTPDENDLRDARQSLSNPSRRLLDELFWFWPMEPGATTDPALSQLAAGDPGAAFAIWQQASNSSSPIAIHNLAVLHHLIALDWEYAEQALGSLSPSEMLDRDRAWDRAFYFWNRIADDDAFWELVERRIEAHRDARLKSDSAGRIRRALPKILLVANALLASRAADAGDHQAAARHVALIRSAEFGREHADSVLRWIAESTRDRLASISKSAMDASDPNSGDPTVGEREAQQLLERSRPLLDVLDLFLAKGDVVRDGVHDEVALNILQCQIRYGNATKNWTKSARLLDLANSIAISESARDRIKENLDIVKDNLKFARANTIFEKCWFCRTHERDLDSDRIVAMHGDVRREAIVGGTRVTWKKLAVKVPRCKQCKKWHLNYRKKAIIGSVAAGLLGLAFVLVMFWNSDDSTYNPNRTPPIIPAVIIIGSLAASGAGLGLAIADLQRPSTVWRPTAATDFPIIKQNQFEGWKLGENPSQNAWAFNVKDPSSLPICPDCRLSYGLGRKGCRCCATLEKYYRHVWEADPA